MKFLCLEPPKKNAQICYHQFKLQQITFAADLQT
jgi:hypothetical protein